MPVWLYNESVHRCEIYISWPAKGPAENSCLVQVIISLSTPDHRMTLHDSCTRCIRYETAHETRVLLKRGLCSIETSTFFLTLWIFINGTLFCRWVWPSQPFLPPQPQFCLAWATTSSFFWFKEMCYAHFKRNKCSLFSWMLLNKVQSINQKRLVFFMSAWTQVLIREGIIRGKVLIACVQ